MDKHLVEYTGIYAGSRYMRISRFIYIKISVYIIEEFSQKKKKISVYKQYVLYTVNKTSIIGLKRKK